VKYKFALAAFLLVLLSSGVAQMPPKGTIYIFRRPYAWPSRYNVFLDGIRIAQMRSGSYFSVVVDPGAYRLETTVSAKTVKSTAGSINPDEEVTQVDVAAGQTVYFEMTFADAHHQGHILSRPNLLATGVFTATPGPVARDRFAGLRPLEAKRAFDPRVQTAEPDFPSR